MSALTGACGPNLVKCAVTKSLCCRFSGAFYTCGQEGAAWVNRGNKFISNTLKNIGSDLWKHLVGEPRREQGQIGVYLDDQMSDWLVADNRFDGYMRTGIALAGGRRNRALRNQFENCGTMHDEGTVNQSGGSCVVLDK